MKRILVFTVTLLLTVLFSACSEQPTQFSVTMGEQYAQHEPITLTVTLPTNAKEHEITFTIDGKEYAIASMPTVNDPTFVFEELPDDGMIKICLSMPSDASDTEVLYMQPEDGSPELCFVATDGDFSRLRDYLGSI